jgi:aldehyde dehydrogenase (NAD+)
VSEPLIDGLAERQRAAFMKGASLDVGHRLDGLRRLRTVVLAREPQIIAALAQDLGKCEFEAYSSEVAPLLAELDESIGHLRAWTRPRRVGTPLMTPAASFVVPEPFGATLIIAPWNYPLQLALIPAVGAIAAGNHVVVKPSEYAPATAQTIADILGESFDPDVACAVAGGVPETQELLGQRWDYIFYTGSTRVGRIVMQAAAESLTPVTLELGGKNPCVVTERADIRAAAKRIAWGKCFNAGQTCVAPDFVLAHRSVRAEFVEEVGRTVASFYGTDPSASPDYGRIVSRAHLDRLAAMLEGEHVAVGGAFDPETLYFAPTVVDGVTWDSPLMREEIFGPILPVLDYDDLPAELARLASFPKPLTFYLFSRDVAERRLAETVPAGAVVTNDTLIQFTNPSLPFGGVGDSGMGAYHGRHTFETFSHMKALLRRRRFPRLLGVRWPPYRLPMWLIKFSLKWFG